MCCYRFSRIGSKAIMSLLLTRDFLMQVIQMYKSYPCLWQAKHPHYRNSTKRNAALNTILEFFKTKDPDINLDTVKKRLTSLRNCVKKEYNKVQLSIQSGADEADLHVPKLWYYNEMLFLLDGDVPKSKSKTDNYNLDSSKSDDYILESSKSDDYNLDSSKSDNYIISDIPVGDSVEISDEEYEDNELMDAPSPLSPSSVASSSRSTKRKTKVETDYIIAKIAKQLEESKSSPQEKPRYSSFGEHIAEKLRSMPTMMATYCQKIINDAIFMAETNNLTVDSHIVNRRK